MTAEAISRFTGEYDFLSNFYPVTLEYWAFAPDESYTKTSTAHRFLMPTSEHLFQALKVDRNHPDYLDWVTRIADAPSPGEAKKLGRQAPLRPDWEDHRITAMSYAVIKKFNKPFLKERLLDTGDAQLIEGNTWGDTFWGVSQQTGEGENRLGEMLMAVRGLMREGTL